MSICIASPSVPPGLAIEPQGVYLPVRLTPL
jgi:hypothetical protein